MKGGKLYEQIALTIRQKIESGIYQGGQQLPSEIEFGKEFEVSRTTIRRAVDALVEQGLVVRKNGVGLFVAAQISTQNILEMTKVMKPEVWEQSSAVVKEANLRKAGEYFSKVLHIEINELLYQIVFTQIVKGEKLQERLLLPLNNFPDFDLSQIQILSVLELMNTGRHNGQELHQSLELIMPNKQLAKALEIAIDNPVFKFSNTLLDENNMPIALEYRYENALKTKYVIDYS
jgi:DNA-binding GntR family transcriptional regulator